MTNVVFYSIGVTEPITPAEPLPPLPAIPRRALVVLEGLCLNLAIRHRLPPPARVPGRSNRRIRPTPRRRRGRLAQSGIPRSSGARRLTAVDWPAIEGISRITGNSPALTELRCAQSPRPQHALSTPPRMFNIYQTTTQSSQILHAPLIQSPLIGTRALPDTYGASINCLVHSRSSTSSHVLTRGDGPCISTSEDQTPLACSPTVLQPTVTSLEAHRHECRTGPAPTRPQQR